VNADVSAMRVEGQDASDGSQYFELICNACHSVLLTFQRLGTQSAEAKHPARCPHWQRVEYLPWHRGDLRLRLSALRPERSTYAARAVKTRSLGHWAILTGGVCAACRNAETREG
jgi:hypothetical protein